MGVSPLMRNPSAAGVDDPQNVSSAGAAPPTPSWVRPVAIAIFVVAVAVVITLVFRYLLRHSSFEAPPGSPQVGMTLFAGAIALMAAAAIVFRPERGTKRALVATSVTWSLTFLLGLVLAWAAIATFNRQDAWHGTPVLNPADVDAYLAEHVPEEVDPILIPTGVLIKSLEFLNGDNVQVSGFVWQKYGPEIPEDLVRGVVLAEGVRDPYKETVAYRYEENGIETIGWYFETVLRQPFEYAEFPFDEQDVWLRLWAKDFTQDTVLVPDFDSYVSLDPRALPGLEKEFVYSGWTPLYSGFSLSNQPYSSSFGIGAANQYAGLPEMYFNLIIDRDFAGPFFEHLVFAIAVMFMLFGLLALTTNDENLKARFQLSTAGTLTAASGLLFAVILKHNQLRGAIGPRGVSYIEVIPIVLYLAIIVVVLNAILVASPYNVRVIHQRNNLWPVLGYWPVMIGTLFLVTLVVFFRP